MFVINLRHPLRPVSLLFPHGSNHLCSLSIPDLINKNTTVALQNYVVGHILGHNFQLESMDWNLLTILENFRLVPMLVSGYILLYIFLYILSFL